MTKHEITNVIQMAFAIFVFAFLFIAVIYMAASTDDPVRCLKYEGTDYLTRGERVYHCLQWSDEHDRSR